MRGVAAVPRASGWLCRVSGRGGRPGERNQPCGARRRGLRREALKARSGQAIFFCWPREGPAGRLAKSVGFGACAARVQGFRGMRGRSIVVMGQLSVGVVCGLLGVFYFRGCNKICLTQL